MLSSKRKKQFTYVTIGFFFLLSGIEYSIILPTLWMYLEVAFHAEVYFFGIALSAFPFAGIISSLLIGRISDITGRTSLLLFICNLIQIGGGILYAFAPSAWMLVTGRFLAGVGNGVSSALFGDIAKSSETSRITYIFARFFAIRQFGLIIGPCFNLFLYKLTFYIGPFSINAFNSPGLLIAVLWFVHNVMVIFFFYNLKNISKQECLENMRDEASNLTRASQNYGAFDINSVADQTNSHMINNDYANNNIDNDINIDKDIINNIVNCDKEENNGDKVYRSYSSSSASDIFMDMAEKCLSDVKARRISLPHYNRLYGSYEFLTSSPYLQKCRSEGNFLDDSKMNYGIIDATNHYICDKSRTSEFKQMKIVLSIDNSNSNQIENEYQNQDQNEYPNVTDITYSRIDDRENYNYVVNGYGDGVNTKSTLLCRNNKETVGKCRRANCDRVNCFHDYLEYLRPEIIAILATFFMGTFNQAAMESLFPLLSQGLFNWGEFEISIAFLFFGLEIILVAVLLKPINKRISDRNLILIGTNLQMICICVLLIFIPNSRRSSRATTMGILLSVVFIDLIGLPLQLIASTSLFSKLTPKHTQGFSQGVQKLFVGIGLILGPLWASSLLSRPYILFPTMLAVNCIGLTLILASFTSLKIEHNLLENTRAL